MTSPTKKKWQHNDGKQLRRSQEFLANLLVVVCHWCNTVYRRGGSQCPDCGTAFDEERSAKARIRNTRAYRDIALDNARRDGTVTKVTKELKIAERGGMLGRGEAADIVRKSAAYVRKTKGQRTWMFNNQIRKRKGPVG